ncbi:PepSY domain-containing protein [Horticoccus luteus]|uniref:PepSY domain-containing protein n=1 Tax=Horticoccus luteus TaxID=2862869 RepID=A0A8F9TUI8_9BACT|nr:PepSY-associated TM helix domain-containing protein [Horticoccus luteus]QYM77822.1 PepSY domain-containing protein [Horticoccus luteus]
MRLRKILFWLHLFAGVFAGLVIAIMCFTGAVLAFEKQITAWAERDVRLVTPPADASAPLPLTQLQRDFRAAQPESRSTSLTVFAAPNTAVAFSVGRASTFYVNPYTGEVRAPTSARLRTILRATENWHRWLGVGGDHRAAARAVTGACTLAFGFLALSGLYLWWPRTLSWRGFKSVALLNVRLAGKARDFNWHNATGLWCAPVLIVLTLTAVPMSYRWGNTLLYGLAGESAPTTTGPARASTSIAPIAPPSAAARRLSPDQAVAVAQKEFPSWTQISLVLGDSERRRPNSNTNSTPPSSASAAESSQQRRADAPAGVRPLTLIVKESSAWPRTATATLTVDPFTGHVLKRETFAELSLGRRFRTWSRFLHTGEALGWPGQLVAGLASLGGLVLVYTGFALALRRFLNRRSAQA